MKAIKTIGILTLYMALFCCGCDKEELISESLYEGPSFVRFQMILNNNMEPLEDGFIDLSEPAADSVSLKSLKTLKIPVALTCPSLREPVSVDFKTETNGNFNGFSISPESRLTFNKQKLTDTITISFNQRWDYRLSPAIKLELTNCSDVHIHLGNVDEFATHKSLSINFSELFTTASFSENQIEINGEAGEEVRFRLHFPEGVLKDEFENTSLIKYIKGFDFQITADPIKDGDTEVWYTLTVGENINKDDVLYLSKLELANNGLYAPVGNKVLQIVKPIRMERDKASFPAFHFYDLSNPYYRTYGENWMYDENDGLCHWQSFNTFTYPVEVEADHPDAVLFSDNGTPDPADDIYHHAFRIGFDTFLSGRTTNSFNLKRWFSNEASDEDVSPGFNIPQALDFYPENGNSTTRGTVVVVPQPLTISSREDKSYTINISGEGTYHEIDPGIFEIALTLKAENQELFGGTITSEYRIYNTREYAEPAPNDGNCIATMEL